MASKLAIGQIRDALRALFKNGPLGEFERAAGAVIAVDQPGQDKVRLHMETGQKFLLTISEV